MKYEKYKITIRKTRGGAVLGYHETTVITDKPPKEGDKQTFLLMPPIVETIVNVEKLKNE